MSIDITEPFPEWAFPLAWGWVEKRLGQIADDFFPRTPGEFVERYFSRYSRTLALWKDGSLSGVIAFEQASPIVVTAHILLSRRLWGSPAEELRQAAKLLFESQPEIIRIQAFIPAWNRLAVAMVRRIGGEVEGVLRACTLRDGKPADAVLMGLTREEFTRGAELRRRIEPKLDKPERDAGCEQDILGTADSGAKSVGDLAQSGPDGGDKRNNVAGSDRTANAVRRRDKQDVKRPRRQDAKISVAKGVRIKRRVGKGATGNGTRATGRPRK